ncbi:MAG: hypothetical protein ACRBM6_04705 [Geminicoccales bacterium]
MMVLPGLPYDVSAAVLDAGFENSVFIAALAEGRTNIAAMFDIHDE